MIERHVRPRPNPELTDARLHRAQAHATRDGHTWLRQLCRAKRHQNWDNHTEHPNNEPHRRSR